MMEHTADKLAQLRAIVEHAKPVPMSASCMVNRHEVLALIDDAQRVLAAEFAEAADLTQNLGQAKARAQQEADDIVRAAEDKAEYMVDHTTVLETATRKARQLEQQTSTETEALKREADAYVDSRIAAFEAGLQKTLNQVQTMRARLSSRSGLDEGDEQTTLLPRPGTE